MSGYSLLNGLRVLEVAQLAPSSLGGHLADLGAEVIKIESGPLGDPVRVGGSRAIGDPDGPAFMHLRWNRGKKSVALDLRSAEGARAFLDLARSCDAVIEGMRGGYLDWLGIGFDRLREVNPAIVLCTVSGMGTDGPYRGLGTGGPVFDAYAGLREVETPEQPPAQGIAGSTSPPIAMYALGAYGAMGLLAALHRAAATGTGCRIEVSGIDVAAAWMPDLTDAELNRDRSIPRPTWLPDGRLPDWPRLEAYRTKDGKAMLFGSHVEKFWRNFLTAVGREDLADVDLTTADAGAPARAVRMASAERYFRATDPGRMGGTVPGARNCRWTGEYRRGDDCRPAFPSQRQHLPNRMRRRRRTRIRDQSGARRGREFRTGAPAGGRSGYRPGAARSSRVRR